MTPTSTGRFRVLDADGETLVLVDREEYEPLTVASEPDAAAALRPGHLVDADLEWSDGTARLAEWTVVERTLFAFADGVTGLFEVALDVWAEARRERLGVNSRVTYDADRRPNGALYAFADGGAGDVFEELRRGTRPLEPLLERAAEGRDPPFEVFVLRPANHQFVLVYIVFERGGILADTVRDTYGCPRSSEPDASSDGVPPEPSEASVTDFDPLDALDVDE